MIKMAGVGIIHYAVIIFCTFRKCQNGRRHVGWSDSLLAKISNFNIKNESLSLPLPHGSVLIHSFYYFIVEGGGLEMVGELSGE